MFAVDWILTFAFEHIKDIKTVHLTGCIKNATRKKWESRLQRYRYVGEIPATLHEEKEVIREMIKGRM